ncbi:MAG: 50S ribosomal protein L18 [Mycoplasma sp.]
MLGKNITNQRRRHLRLRKRLIGTSNQPRLCVTISNKYISAQIIDDSNHHTLAFATTQTMELANKNNIEAATKLGEVLANRAKEKNITSIVFDRAGRKYHGKVQAFADACRANGLIF